MKPSRLAARVASRARSDICCARFWIQVEDVQDASGAPVTVAERVNGLELVVYDGHLDERIDSVRRAWMRMDRFGRDSASALTRASATLASMQVLRMAGVSRSVLGGNSGRAFQGTRGSYGRAGGVSTRRSIYFFPEIIHAGPGSGQGEHAYFLALGEARRMTSVVSGAPPAPSPRTCSESGSTSPSSEQTGAAAPTFYRPCASVPCCRRSTLLPRSPACARPRTDRHRRRVCRRAGAG